MGDAPACLYDRLNRIGRIKRDPTLFPTLHDEKLNGSLHHSFVNQACAQDVSKVLDPNYMPLDDHYRQFVIFQCASYFACRDS